MLEIDIKASSNSDIQIVTLTGEFSFADQKRAETLISNAITDDLQGMVFDLTGVTYMEEAGFETLMLYLQRLLESGVCMAAIVAPGSMLMSKLERMGFFAVGLKLFGSAKEAEEAIQNGGCKQ